MSLNRLQKIRSQSGLLSRLKDDLLIKQVKATLNGKRAILEEKADPMCEHILLDGKDLPKRLKNIMLLLNKPNGVISSYQDNHGRKAIISLIPSQLHLGMHPEGRLDFDSRGAILFTNNEYLMLMFTHPKYSYKKTYLVWESGQPIQSMLDNWRKGILLNSKMKMPARIEVLDKVHQKTLLKVILKEGRNRQIRRIATLIGNLVKDLKRTAISNINLNRSQKGKWRELKTDEWISIIN